MQIAPYNQFEASKAGGFFFRNLETYAICFKELIDLYNKYMSLRLVNFETLSTTTSCGLGSCAGGKSARDVETL
jgi:hypothetical protein